MHILREETDDSLEHGPDGPRGVPLLRVILRDSEADLGICLKPAIFVHEYDIWRFEGVLVGKQDLSVIYSFMELCIFWSLEGEVPVIKIILKRSSMQVGQFFSLKFPELAHDALLADVCRLHILIIITHHKEYAISSG